MRGQLRTLVCMVFFCFAGGAQAALSVVADAVPVTGNAPLSVDFSGGINQCLPLAGPPSLVQVGQGANQTSVATFTIKNISNQPMNIWRMVIETGNANSLIAADLDGRSPDAISPAYGTNTQSFVAFFDSDGAPTSLPATNYIVIPPRSSITVVLTYDTPLASGNKELSLGFFDDNNQAIGETGNSSAQTTFSWDFGDGTPVVNLDVVTHTYTTAGTYTATFTATCNGETAAASVTIVVGSSVSGFQIDVPAFSTICGPASIDITALDGNGVAIVDYDGLVSLSTSNGLGDWYVNPYGTVNGTLSNSGGGNNGQATYQFVAADNGTVNLDLSMAVAGGYSVTVSDATAGVSSTSALVNFLNAADSLRITTDPIQVAGRPQAMTVEKLLDDCSVDTNYQNNRQMRAWLSRDADDPGGAAPSISGAPLPNATPAAPNLSLDFILGVASFSLGTTDVGKYRVNMSQGPRAGSSGIITTRPFGLGFTNIQSNDATPLANPGGSLQGGNGFVAAGVAFQVRVAGYLWNSADDTLNDGVPDSGVNITDNGPTPSYNWNTLLSAIDPVATLPSPCGTVDNAKFSGTTLVGMGSFGGGAATVSDLVYLDVGCIALRAEAANFLNSAGVNAVGTTFYSGAPETLVGRFFPHHFSLNGGGSISPFCVVGAPACLGPKPAVDFTYMGQANLGIGFSLVAKSAAPSFSVTTNYDQGLYGVNQAIPLWLAEDNDNNIDLGNRLTPIVGSWANGVFDFNSNTVEFSRLTDNTLDGPFDQLRIGVSVQDPSGVPSDVDGADVLAADFSVDCLVPVTPGDVCTGLGLDGGLSTSVRFGRLVLLNAFGTETAALPVPLFAEYYLGANDGFVLNDMDVCSTYSAVAITLSNFTGALQPWDTSASISGDIAPHALSCGISDLALSAPGAGNDGSVQVSSDLSSATGINQPWLQFDWDADGLHDNNPSGTATFGIFGGDDAVIYIRENY